MKKLLNTLYVTSQGSYLSKDGECVVVRADDGKKKRFPAHILDGIVCFGNVLCSPFLLGHCADAGLSVSFLTERGRFLARVCGPQSGNVLLRREQYRQADDPEASARMARSVLAGKVVNSRAVLRRCIRDHGDRIDAPRMNGAVAMLDDSVVRLRTPVGLDEARGMEGAAANAYFSVFGNLILREEEAFAFAGRNRARRWMPSTACFRSSIRCWPMTSVPHWKRWASIPRWASCTGTGRAARDSLWTPWRSSGPFWRTGWRCR